MTLFTGSRNAAQLQTELDTVIDDLDDALGAPPVVAAIALHLESPGSTGNAELHSTIFTPHADCEVLGLAIFTRDPSVEAPSFRLGEAENVALTDKRDTLTQSGYVTFNTPSGGGLTSAIPARRYFLRRGQRYRLSYRSDQNGVNPDYLGVSLMLGIIPRKP